MTYEAKVTRDWSGDERTFRLTIEQLLSLQEVRNSGPLEIINRLRLGTWLIEDVKEVLRLGLIGGGSEGRVARRVTDEAVIEGKIVDAANLAFDVLWAALYQPEEIEPLGKAEATGAPEMDVSQPSHSLETAQQ